MLVTKERRPVENLKFLEKKEKQRWVYKIHKRKTKAKIQMYGSEGFF